jgi:nicotinate-nucleotide pyrophosphorylase (carboxylating)
VGGTRGGLIAVADGTADRVAALAEHPAVRRLVATALEEDIGRGDVTSAAALPPGLRATATISTEEPCIVAGLFLAPIAYRLLDPTLVVDVLVAEGARAGVETPVVRIAGAAAAILAGERVVLNLLQHLAGVATLTSRFVAAVAGTRAAIVDTRKTIPGLRLLEKHAVRMGGGVNHRFGLDDGILIKNTHVALGGGTAAVVARVRAAAPSGLRVQVECRSGAEVEAALGAGADALLLDNQTPEQAGALIRIVAGRAAVELSGGITLANVAAYAAAGADRISIGALTHSAPAVPLHLRIHAAT